MKGLDDLTTITEMSYDLLAIQVSVSEKTPEIIGDQIYFTHGGKKYTPPEFGQLLAKDARHVYKRAGEAFARLEKKTDVTNLRAAFLTTYQGFERMIKIFDPQYKPKKN